MTIIMIIKLENQQVRREFGLERKINTLSHFCFLSIKKNPIAYNYTKNCKNDPVQCFEQWCRPTTEESV